MELLKKLIVGGILLLTLTSCTKEYSFEAKPVKEEHTTAQRASVFPTYIKLGSDTTYGRTDSVCLTNYEAYLATCGMDPALEAPIMGTTIYQILGPTYVYIGWTTVNFKRVPTLTNLKPGVYTIVGNAYMYGFRPCDSTYQDVSVSDTINITILKSRKKK